LDLFVYGTLMVPEVMGSVSGRRPAGESARLQGYRRRRLRGEVYPGIVPAPDERVDGLVYRDLDHAAMARLDMFEGEMYRREPVEIETTDGRRSRAETYVIRPEFSDQLSSLPWTMEGFLADGLPSFVDEFQGFGRVDEPPDDERS
jgi:gamma-glutamylcyclotransferase (GGCT)/AIG2-like uncharacterized protein YtfP